MTIPAETVPLRIVVSVKASRRFAQVIGGDHWSARFESGTRPDVAHGHAGECLIIASNPSVAAPTNIRYDACFNVIAAIPAATLRPASPSMLIGCKDTVWAEPPVSTLASAPTPTDPPAVTPT
jgi:hypothetical protein